MTAPGWAAHLKGVDPKSVDLARRARRSCRCCASPICIALQKAAPPFGGFNVTPPGKAKRLHMSPGPIFEPQGHGEDFGGAARALFAAGFRAGDVVHNSFSYHLTPGAYILEAGAHALGCATIPGGIGNTEQQLEAIAHLKPGGYIGTPDFLKILLDTAEKSGKDASSIKRGLVSGAALPASLREELRGRGVAVLQCYAIAETGVIAYESEAREGMIVNETLIAGDRAARHRRSGRRRRSRRGGRHLVQSGLSDDPARHRRSVGGDGGRLAVRAHQRAHQGLDGPRRPDHQGEGHVRPSRRDRGGRQAPSRARPRAAAGHPRGRAGRHDASARNAPSRSAGLAEAVAATLQSVTKLKGAVELVTPGSLPNDGKVIADERPVG